MNLNKVAMSDDQLDQVSGGTMIPHQIQPGESLDMIVAKYKNRFTKAQLAQWNNMSENGTLEVGKTLNIYF